MKKTSGEKLRGCAICKREFYTKKELEKHAYQYHYLEDNVAGRIFKSAVKSAKKLKVNSDTNCAICAVDFSLPTELEKHMRRWHEEEEMVVDRVNLLKKVGDSVNMFKGTEELPCSVCSMRFLTPLHLEQHREGCSSRKQDTELLLVEEGEEEEQGCFLCEPCGMEFSSLAEQEEHMAMHRGGAARASLISCKR